MTLRSYGALAASYHLNITVHHRGSRVAGSRKETTVRGGHLPSRKNSLELPKLPWWPVTAGYPTECVVKLIKIATDQRRAKLKLDISTVPAQGAAFGGNLGSSQGAAQARRDVDCRTTHREGVARAHADFRFRFSVQVWPIPRTDLRTGSVCIVPIQSMKNHCCLTTIVSVSPNICNEMQIEQRESCNGINTGCQATR